MVQEFADAANNPVQQAAIEQAENDKAERLFSMSDAVGQEFYGVGPSMGPDRLRDVARMFANFENRIAGTSEWSIGGSGPLGQSLQERLREKEKEDQEYFAEQISQIAEQQQREREEWARTEVSFAGATMTGRKWGEMGEELSRDGELRRSLIDRMVRDGKTREEAERKATEMADVYRALSKPEPQRSDAERAAVQRAQSDPDIQRYTSTVSRDFTAGSRPRSSSERRVENSDQHVSVEARADVLSSAQLPNHTSYDRETSTRSAAIRSTDFPSAPNLTAHHHQAVAAREPLEPAARLAQVASTSPSPQSASTPGSGFEV